MKTNNIGSLFLKYPARVTYIFMGGFYIVELMEIQTPMGDVKINLHATDKDLHEAFELLAQTIIDYMDQPKEHRDETITKAIQQATSISTAEEETINNP